MRDDAGTTYAIEVGDYFNRIDGQIRRWLFASAPEEAKRGVELFEVPRFTRTLSEWINMLISAGFAIEQLSEPRPDAKTLERYPHVQDAQVVAYFLHIRARKPLDGP